MATILVVDDEPDIRYLTQVNLELDGHRVMTAANGREALAAVMVETPDLILLDVMMPDVDGWQVLEEVKANANTDISHVRVLMMTALGTDDDRLRGGIEGAVRYLVKPVSPEQLRSVVVEVLEAGPEPELRRQVQTGALSELARIERGGIPISPDEPRPRLSKYEHARPRLDDGEPEPIRVPEGQSLTTKQIELLRRLVDSPSVSATAQTLGVSRSNVYASLRRVARKLDIDSVPELLRQLRAGHIEFES